MRNIDNSSALQTKRHKSNHEQPENALELRHHYPLFDLTAPPNIRMRSRNRLQQSCVLRLPCKTKVQPDLAEDLAAEWWFFEGTLCHPRQRGQIFVCLVSGVFAENARPFRRIGITVILLTVWAGCWNVVSTRHILTWRTGLVSR